MIQIALDIMGGDNAPEKVIMGVSHHSNNSQNIIYNIFGDEDLIKNYLNKYKINNSYNIFHTKETAHADGGKGHHAPIVEFFLDTDKTPLLTFDRVRLMGYAVEPYVMRIIDLDYILKDLFQQIGFTLVDFEAGFGRDADGRFLVNKLDIDNMTIWKNNVENKYLIGAHKYILKHLLEVS